MTIGRILALVGVAVLVLVINVLVSVLYMFVYGYVIDPGHDNSYYQDHIKIAAPYCSIVAGMPIMFVAGYWVAGWWRQTLGHRGAIVVWLAYVLIDISALLAAGLTLGIAVLFLISFATKLAAVYIGAKVRLRKPEEIQSQSASD